jgi:hypothetical protein
LDAQRGDGSTASTFPKLLTHTGENYLYRAGASVSNNCSVPNLAAYNPTTSFSITARVAFDNWNTPSGTNDILQRTTFADPDRQFAFFLTTGGVLRLAITPTGNNASIINIDSLALNVPAGETRWVQVTFNGNDGAGNRVTTFEIAPDQETEPTSWTVNRQVTTAGTVTFTPVTASMFMGAAIDTAAKYFRTIYRVGGVVQMDADFTTGIIDGDQTSFVESSTNAATVTINRAASGRKSVAVTRLVVLFGADDYWEIPDNDLLDFGATDSFTVMVVNRTWGTISNNSVAGKGTSVDATMTGYQMFFSGGVSSYRFGDGTNRVGGLGAPSPVSGQLRTLSMHRDVSLDRAWATTDGVLSGLTTVDTTTGSLANSNTFRVGGSSSLGYSDMELFAVAVWRRALTAAEIAAVAQFYEVTTSPSWVHLLQLEDGTPMLDESGLPIELE